MDHISATQGLSKTERENISGARVFDGEDQGKFNQFYCMLSNDAKIEIFEKFRSWKQIQNAAVTAKGLVRATNLRKENDERS